MMHAQVRPSANLRLTLCTLTEGTVSGKETSAERDLWRTDLDLARTRPEL
jgi:hypothetical protein